MGRWDGTQFEIAVGSIIGRHWSPLPPPLPRNTAERLQALKHRRQIPRPLKLRCQIRRLILTSFILVIGDGLPIVRCGGAVLYVRRSAGAALLSVAASGPCFLGLCQRVQPETGRRGTRGTHLKQSRRPGKKDASCRPKTAAVLLTSRRRLPADLRRSSVCIGLGWFYSL